jgi:uncharacterized protein
VEGQRKRTGHIPQRTCIVCRSEKTKRELVRLVHTAGGSVEVDASGKKPGRGAYLCQSPDCWKKALDKGRLDRALRAKTSPESRTRLAEFADQYCAKGGSLSCQVGET